ncbi:DUF3231 family protein [Peribacillus glennii]|uniref:DUF3231 family protein n=1 Tax=Peribacillus glennii TaxID=2303991 RepID=A0A372LJV2_9BACI|nr:DUF3231 family protein [Peribacillus glennii]RFU66764.1 DUF3231 family protein [Peribacillus glennii]
MSNIFEALMHTLKTAMDNEPQSRLHTGEVMICWLYYTAMTEALHYEEDALNMTTDDEVIEMLKDAIKTCGSQASRLEQFLTKEGVPLPTMPASKPKSDPEEVPLGVKLTDNEIANGVSVKIAYMNVQCATAQSQSVRTDVGYMFMEFQAELLIFGAILKPLMKKRGWLRVPPYYYPPGSPDN